ncbi:TLP18.3, Psb32 and MOLO-1 founding protein of phosphatase [Roseateles sp. YR242]|uniref:TPM domain-containing protein n=1 Tax=Roseateles sp. YR242 TaxID=1855305 RepID=UPI0008C3F726|nr:TPM domain-containing protein [Roseateles sp. YR242]SEK77432.1 TLP18.3, Psb32 and MOLO-1 founding protein of phosphatase [Roseateles sp. YR242]
MTQQTPQQPGHGQSTASARPSRLARLFRHRLWDEADARRVLPEAALTRLSGRVTQSEQRHGGEIRLCVEASLPLSYLWRHAPARERAVTLFGKLRVWDTEHNNGVLIYLLLAEHAIEIVADRGLNLRVSAAQWHTVIEGLRSYLQGGQFEQGLMEAIRAVEGLLAEHFPPTAAPPRNELPDAVVVL